MLKARKSSQLKPDPVKDKKLYETKKLKKAGQGTAVVSTAEKEKTVFRKVKLDKDLKLPQIKKLYSQLKTKQKEKEVPTLVKHNMVAQMFQLVKPNFKKIEFKRIGCRVLMACLKYGSAATRKELLGLLEKDFISLCFGKYSYSLAKLMAKTPNTELKNKLASLVKQNLLKLLRSPESAEVAEAVFETANLTTQNSIIDAFYGNEYAAYVATKGLSLKEYLKQNEDAIRDNLEPRISKLIDKALITLSIVQHIILSFIQASDVEIHLRLMSESNLQVSYSGLLSSRIGVKVACYFYTIADAKQRKHFVKELKEEVVEYSKNKVTFLVILKMLRHTDDTVLTKRLLLSKLTGEADALIVDPNYQKLIGSIMSNNFKIMLTEDEASTLTLGSEVSTSKKATEKRIAELFDIENVSRIATALQKNMEKLLKSQSYKFIAVVAGSAIEKFNQQEEEERAHSLMRKINEAIEESKVDFLLDSAGHRFVKQLIKIENKGPCKEKPLISTHLWKKIKDQFVKYMKEKSVFVIVALMENCEVLNSQILKVARANLKSIEKEVKALEKKGSQKSGARLLYDLVK